MEHIRISILSVVEVKRRLREDLTDAIPSRSCIQCLSTVRLIWEVNLCDKFNVQLVEVQQLRESDPEWIPQEEVSLPNHVSK